MFSPPRPGFGVITAVILTLTFVIVAASARAEPVLREVTRHANGEITLGVQFAEEKPVRLDWSRDLDSWKALVTLAPARGGTDAAFTDSAAPYLAARYYRAVEVEGTSVAGDHLATDAGDVLIHPVGHATLVLIWNGVTIYVDPGRGTGPFPGIPAADLVLITHEHGDHFDSATVRSILAGTTRIIAGQHVFDNSLSAAMQAQATVLANGESLALLGLTVEAVAMYNLPPGNIYHPEGRGNGYVLTIGGKRIYVSGDTEDTPEMRALRNIDVAFLAMNQPFTMTVDQAVSAAREFRPAVVYPYHYSDSDVDLFKQLVGSDLGIEVRLRNWYP